MNIDHLISDVLRGVLGGRRKKSRRATRFLTGNMTRGVTRGVMRNPQTLLGIAGEAWGIFETLQNQNRVPAPAAGAGAAPMPAAGALPPPLPVDDERLSVDGSTVRATDLSLADPVSGTELIVSFEVRC